jgi:O-antigen/teichoic acid export membrane protein
VVLVAETGLAGSGLGPLLAPLAVAELFFARLVDLAAQCFQARDRVRVSANVTLSISVTRLLAVFGFALWSSSTSPVTWSYWYVGASGAAAVVAMALVFRLMALPSFEFPLGLRLVARKGIFFSIGSASKTVYGDIDKTMLAQMVNPGVAGTYTAAYRVVSMGYTPVLALLYASNTRFFRAGVEGAEGVWRVAQRAWPYLLVYCTCLGAVLVAVAPLVPMILGDDFESSVETLRWLAPLPLLTATHSLFGDALMGMGRQALRSAFQVGTAGLNVLLNLWLIPLHSWRGAVVATLVCEGLLALSLLVLLLHLRRVKRSPGTRPPEAP